MKKIVSLCLMALAWGFSLYEVQVDASVGIVVMTLAAGISGFFLIEGIREKRNDDIDEMSIYNDHLKLTFKNKRVQNIPKKDIVKIESTPTGCYFHLKDGQSFFRKGFGTMFDQDDQPVLGKKNFPFSEIISSLNE